MVYKDHVLHSWICWGPILSRLSWKSDQLVESARMLPTIAQVLWQF